MTREHYNVIVFAVHSFLRPTETELFGIRHCDIEVMDTEPSTSDDADRQDWLSQVSDDGGSCDIYAEAEESASQMLSQLTMCSCLSIRTERQRRIPIAGSSIISYKKQG